MISAKTISSTVPARILDVPELTITLVIAPSRDFTASLGEDVLYAFDRKVVGVLTNDRRPWSSVKSNLGDRVVVFPAW